MKRVGGWLQGKPSQSAAGRPTTALDEQNACEFPYPNTTVIVSSWNLSTGRSGFGGPDYERWYPMNRYVERE